MLIHKRVPAQELGRVLITLSAVAREIDAPRDTMTGVVFHPTRLVNVDGTWERLPRIRVHRLKPLLGITAQTTVLLMDGTGSLALNEAVFGALEHVHTPVERDAHVIGTRGKTYSRQSITGCNRSGQPMSDRTADSARLRRELAVVAGRLPGQVMVASTKPAVEALKAEKAMPATVAELAHFGKVRGLNTWEDCASGLVIGTQSVSVEALEDVTRAFYATDPQPFFSSAVPAPSDWPRTGWPYVACRGRRMRDGSVLPIEVEVHPDPRAQEVLEQIREAEVVQTADRLRPVFNRREIVLANNLVLPITYDRTMTHAELVAGGTRLEQAFCATGLLPLGAADLHRTHKGFFPSVARAKDALGEAKISGGVSQIELYLGNPPTYLYRRQSQRGSPSRILVDGSRHPNPRGAVEAVLGGLAVFERLYPQPPPIRPEPPPVRPAAPSSGSTRPDYAEAYTDVRASLPMPIDKGAPSMETPHEVPITATEEAEQAGLDPGAIYRGPVAWHPPIGLYRTATGRLIEETEFKPQPDPWLLRPMALPPAWYDDLAPNGSDDGAWWGPMSPVLPAALAGLAFRGEPGADVPANHSSR